MPDDLEVEVTLVGATVPTKVVLKKITAGERNQALREATKLRTMVANAKNAQMDFDPVLFRETYLMVAIVTPMDLKSLESIRSKLFPKDFDRLYDAAEELNEVNPITSGS